MKIHGRLTPSEFKSGIALFRPKTYWAKLAIANWYGVLLLCVLLYATIKALADHTHANWHALGMMWLIIGAILAGGFYLARFRVGRALAGINRQLTGTFQIAVDGVHGDAESGATSFFPWSTFNAWITGKGVYGLKSATGSVIILPLDGLSNEEAEKLRGILRSSIGEPS